MFTKNAIINIFLLILSVILLKVLHKKYKYGYDLHVSYNYEVLKYYRYAPKCIREKHSLYGHYNGNGEWQWNDNLGFYDRNGKWKWRSEFGIYDIDGVFRWRRGIIFYDINTLSERWSDEIMKKIFNEKIGSEDK